MADSHKAAVLPKTTAGRPAVSSDFSGQLKSWISKGLDLLPGRDYVHQRVRWLEGTLRRIPAHSRLLDAGCGEQQFRVFCSHLDYVSQDFAQYDGKGDGLGGQTVLWDHGRLDIVSDIIEIPEPDASFDAILCVEVLEHVPDAVLALKEFSRLLKPGGQLILTAPFGSHAHFTPFHYATGFNNYWYEWHLKRLGFDIVELRKNGNFFDVLAFEIHLFPSYVRRYCTSTFSFAVAAAAYCIFGLPLVLLLGLLSRTRNRSADVLCFGCHVVARRV
jgi:SAM-dependent methyltransferase